MAPRILWLGPCTLQSLLPLCCPRAPAAILQASASLSSGSRLRTSSSESCPRTHLVLTPRCTLVFLLTPPFSLYRPPALFRVTSPASPSLPFFSRAFLVFLHPRFKQPPSSSNSTQRFAPDGCPRLLTSLYPFFLRPHRFSQSLVITLRVLAPDCVLGLCSLPVPQLFLPCLFLLQIVFSLLLATHQLHPHHLSKSFAYSLLITFPSFQQELPGASRWHLLLPCFPYSCHAHGFPTGCLWGSSLHSLQSLHPSCSLPLALSFKSLGLLFVTVSALPAFSLGFSY